MGASLSVGDRVTIRVFVSGDPPFSYQWYRNGAELPNATKSSLTLTNLTLANAGDYSVVVSNAVGSVTSTAAALEIDTTFVRLNPDPIANAVGSSISWADVDDDGELDLLCSDELFLNDGDGSLIRAPSNHRLHSEGNGNTAVYAWADFDNDGLTDVFHATGFYNEGSSTDRLLRNLGGGEYKLVPSQPMYQNSSYSVTASWGDYDGDGFVDLFVPRYSNWRDALFRNNGNGTFAAVTNTPITVTAGSSEGGAWADYDDDGDVDLLVYGVNYNRLFKNQGNGQFEESDDALIGGDTRTGSWADYDNDGDLDLLATGPQIRFHRNVDGLLQPVSVLDIGIESARTRPGVWGDFDNDGWLDIFCGGIVGPSEDPRHHLYRNTGNGGFERILSGSVVNSIGTCWGASWGDYTGDGFLDLAVASDSFALYRNAGNANRWLFLKLVGTKSNRSAIGAKVRLKATIRGQTFWQRRDITSDAGHNSSKDLRAHFGLGDAMQAEEVRIEWPSGQITELKNIPAKQILTITEPGGKPQLHVTRVQGVEQFSLRGDAGQKYAIEASSDLLTWSEITTLTGASEPVDFNDARRPSSSQTFYRAVVR